MTSGRPFPQLLRRCCPMAASAIVVTLLLWAAPAKLYSATQSDHPYLGEWVTVERMDSLWDIQTFTFQENGELIHSVVRGEPWNLSKTTERTWYKVEDSLFIMYVQGEIDTFTYKKEFIPELKENGERLLLRGKSKTIPLSPMTAEIREITQYIEERNQNAYGDVQPPVSPVNVRSLSLGDIMLWLILGIIVFGAVVSLLLYKKKGTGTPTADESDDEHIITLSEGKTLIEERIKADKMLDEDDWRILYHEADDMIGGFRERLYSVFPLSTQEYRICLLIKYGVNNKGISTLLCRSTSAVSLARKRLHKKLFNEGGKAKDLDKYIRTL